MDIEELRRKNLARLIQEKYAGKQSNFVSETGVNQGETSGLMNKKRVFGERKARKLEKLANLPVGWLDRDNDSIRPVVAVYENDVPTDAIKITHGVITAQAGIDGFQISQIPPEEELPPSYIPESELIRNGWHASDLVQITISGDSMEPSIYAGDIVRIDTSKKDPKDGKVFILNYEGKVVIKRLFRDIGKWIIRSDNSDKARHPDRTFTDRVFIIGEVVQKISMRI